MDKPSGGWCRGWGGGGGSDGGGCRVGRGRGRI